MYMRRNEGTDTFSWRKQIIRQGDGHFLFTDLNSICLLPVNHLSPLYIGHPPSHFLVSVLSLYSVRPSHLYSVPPPICIVLVPLLLSVHPLLCSVRPSSWIGSVPSSLFYSVSSLLYNVCPSLYSVQFPCIISIILLNSKWNCVLDKNLRQHSG